MNPVRDPQKLKELSDFEIMEAPVHEFGLENPGYGMPAGQQVLRMLVKTKYDNAFRIPGQLQWLTREIRQALTLDRAATGIENSWCYVTVRDGVPTDDADAWHLDGASLRTELIPERNYVWTSDGFQYKTGEVAFPEDFDPVRHDLFEYAEFSLEDEPLREAPGHEWYVLSPFCFHRRRPGTVDTRTFIRISFLDIEIRDECCTPNPLLPTQAYGRNPVKSFRDQLTTY